MEKIGQIWNIVWDNSVFHQAIAFVFVVAVLIEFFTLVEYLGDTEFRKTATAIKYFRQLDKPKPNTPKPKLKNQDIADLKQYFGIDDSDNIKRQDKKFLLTKYPSILSRSVPRSSLRFVTTLCTAIGVLGTFYGIQKSLQGINLNFTDSQEIMASIKDLLVGMKTAFSTSLMGLGSGSLFTLILFASDSFRQNKRDGLRNRLSNLAILETADSTNQKVTKSLSLLADKLTGLNQLSAESIGNAVGRSISSQFAGLNQLCSQAIGEAVGQQIQKSITPGLKGIFQEQQKLRELQESQGQRVLQQLIQDLRIEVIEPIAKRLDESAALTREASAAVTTLHQELGGISQSLASSILTIQNFQEKTLQELQRFAHNLGQTLNQFQTDTRGVLQQTSDEINRAVDQSIVGMTTQRTAFEDSAKQAADTFRGIREELEKALRERAEREQQMLEATQTGIIRILTRANQAFQQQSNTLEAVGNNASELMNDARNNLQNTLGNINSTLIATSQSLQADLTQFRQESQADLQAFFQQTSTAMNSAIEGSIQGMTTQRTAFEASAEQAAATFRGIRGELEGALQQRANTEQQMLEATQTGIIRILTRANQAFQQQSNTLESVGNNASELMNDARNNLQNTLGNIDSTLTATSQSLQADLTQFRQESQANLQSFFQQTSTAMNSAIEGSIQGMTTQRTAFEASAEQAAATFRDIREELERALHQRAEKEQQMLEATQTGIIRILTQAHRTFHEQSQTLEAVGNNASELMNDARNNLLATLENIDSTLTATRQTVQDDLTLFRREYQANLQSFFQQQNDLLAGTLGEQRDGLNQVVQNLNQVFQEEATRRSQLTQEINDLVIASGLNDANRLIQLNALATNIGQQVTLVDNSYRNLDQKFADSLNTWQSHLENYTNRTIISQREYFENADRAMNQICGNLLETARVFVAATDDGNLSNGRNGHG